MIDCEVHLKWKHLEKNSSVLNFNHVNNFTSSRCFFFFFSFHKSYNKNKRFCIICFLAIRLYVDFSCETSQASLGVNKISWQVLPVSNRTKQERFETGWDLGLNWRHRVISKHNATGETRLPRSSQARIFVSRLVSSWTYGW